MQDGVSKEKANSKENIDGLNERLVPINFGPQMYQETFKWNNYFSCIENWIGGEEMQVQLQASILREIAIHSCMFSLNVQFSTKRNLNIQLIKKFTNVNN